MIDSSIEMFNELECCHVTHGVICRWEGQSYKAMCTESYQIELFP